MKVARGSHSLPAKAPSSVTEIAVVKDGLLCKTLPGCIQWKKELVFIPQLNKVAAQKSAFSVYNPNFSFTIYVTKAFNSS